VLPRTMIDVVWIDELPLSGEQVQLVLHLSEVPSTKWQTAFYLTPVRYSGQGTLGFMRLPKPTVESDLVRWSVPATQVGTAKSYLGQRVDHANGARGGPRWFSGSSEDNEEL
jgi:hypothetical protein